MNVVDINNLWDSYADILWEPGKHKETCRTYAKELQDIARCQQVQAFDNRLLDTAIKNLRAKGNRNSTINRKMACLSKLLRKHQRLGEIDRLPDFQKLPERNGRIRFLSRDEEAFLFAGLDSIDTAYGNLGAVLVDSGARVGEALSLSWPDIHQNTATFWETKANTPRSVPLTRRAMRVLESQRPGNRRGPFARIRYANFRNAWGKARKKAGLAGDPQIVPHILRHTCASRLAQSGVDIKRIQEFLGHKTLAMTLRYAHLAPRHLDVCADALNDYAHAEAAE